MQFSLNHMVAPKLDYAEFFDLALRLGVNAVVDPKQSVIVRLYSNIHNADAMGLQARRNMNEIARAIHQELMKQGTGKTDTRTSVGKGDAQ